MKNFKEIKEEIKKTISQDQEDDLNGKNNDSNPESPPGSRIKTDSTDIQRNNRRKVMKPPQPVTVKPTNEEAPVMSIGGGAVAPISPPDPSAVYSLQKDRYKKQILCRKKPVETKKIKWNPGRA